jgi:hypothetical protein
MWPWEHLALGYLLFSLGGHARRGWRPTTRSVCVLVVATQLPDLVDKPLAWVFHVFPSGVALGHSVLVAVPACLLAFAFAHRRDALGHAFAFTVGYLSHLLGDLLYQVFATGAVPVRLFLWPVVVVAGSQDVQLFPRIELLFDHFLTLLAGPNGPLYVTLEALLLGTAFALWAVDGYPIGRTLAAAMRPRGTGQ